MKVTADTITDEQIRELCAAIEFEGARGEYAYCVPSSAALESLSLGKSDRRRIARARCAEIWNARHATEQTK